MIFYEANEIKVRPAVDDDVVKLARSLSEGDTNEVWASHHFSPVQAVRYSFRDSVFCLTVAKDPEVLAMFGVGGNILFGEKAPIWMLSSNNLARIKYRFARHTAQFVKLMLTITPYLYNYVDVRNETSLQWLEFSGATIMPPAPYGIEQKDFCYFYFERK